MMQDHYEAYITQRTPDEYWDALEATGWVAEIPSAQRAALKEEVRAAVAESPLYAWTALAVVVFDAESIDGTDPAALSYAVHLAMLAQASHGLFQPTRIQNVYTNGYNHISFEHHGHPYTYDARADSDYFDPAVLGVINRAIREEGTSRQYIPLPAMDQVMHLALVSEPVYQRAEKAYLIPPPRYFLYKQNQSVALVNAYLDTYYRELMNRSTS